VYAAINDPPDLPCMIDRVSRCAPDADDAIFTTATFNIVFRTIHLSPGMRSTHSDAPSPPLGITQCVFYILVGVLFPFCHEQIPGFDASLVQPSQSCQLTIMRVTVAHRPRCNGIAPYPAHAASIRHRETHQAHRLRL